MRFTKVHLAALAFVAGVLPAAVSADGWFSRAGETKEVTLTEILKNPREYIDVEVEFKVYFNETGRNFNPYFTQFGEEQYGNFSAWPIDARLYDKRDFPRPYPFFFASKFTKAWKKVKDVDHLRVIELTAVVRQVFKGQPWIEVLEWDGSSGGLSEDDIRDVIHADANFVAGKYKDAARLYDRADSSSLPDSVRADLLRRLGDACFHMGDYGEALDAYRTALRHAPESEVLKQGAEAADAARQRARAARKGQAVEGDAPVVASQDQPAVGSNGVDEVIRLLEDPAKVEAEIAAWREALAARAAELNGGAPGATAVAGREPAQPVEEPAEETAEPTVTREPFETGCGEPAVEPEGCAEQPSGCAETPVEEPAAEPVEPEAVQPAEPEATQPEAAEPEATEPEMTEPEAAEQPEAVEPEMTEPEAVEPEATQPEAVEPEATEAVEAPAGEQPAEGCAEAEGEGACGGEMPAEGCAEAVETADDATETVEMPVEEPVAYTGDERVVWVSGQMVRLPRLPFFGAEDVTDDDLRAIIEEILLNPETDE